jgi:hypothetical protein
MINFFFLFRICELLQSGAIMNKFYQPHEAHIPYLLQLFIDYNLYGMNLINLAAVKFRKARRKSRLIFKFKLTLRNKCYIINDLQKRYIFRK